MLYLEVCLLTGIIFIIPKAVTNEIDKSCKAFLLCGGSESRKGGVVTCDKVCKPKNRENWV